MSYGVQGQTITGLTIGIRELVGKKQVLKAVKAGVRRLDRSIKIATTKSIKKERKPGFEWQKPTGQLRASWTPFFKVENGGSTVTFGTQSTLPYAGIHDTGGTIYPKKKYLAIPLDKDARNRGWPRTWKGNPELKFGFSDAGNAFLYTPQSAEERKASQKARRLKAKKSKAKSNKKMPPLAGKPRFILKKSVTLKGTQYMDKAAKAASGEISKIMVNHFAGVK